MALTQYSVAIIGGAGDPRTSDATLLAAALFSLGVRAIERCPFVETVEIVDGAPKRAHSWHLCSDSPCGKYKPADLRPYWHDPTWLTRNRGHVLARICAAFHYSGEPQHDLAGKLPPDWLAYGRAVSRELACRDALSLLGKLREELKKSVPLMIVRDGERRALIPVDASPEETAALLSSFKNRK